MSLENYLRKIESHVMAVEANMETLEGPHVPKRRCEDSLKAMRDLVDIARKDIHEIRSIL